LRNGDGRSDFTRRSIRLARWFARFRRALSARLVQLRLTSRREHLAASARPGAPETARALPSASTPSATSASRLGLAWKCSQQEDRNDERNGDDRRLHWISSRRSAAAR
jgi:hypothetical protein